MDSVLQSREADPEEVLFNLGFAESEAFAKIPLRFLKQPSKAKGVSIENFKKNQAELFGRYDSGFFGYRGLQGDIYCIVKSKRRNLEDDIEKCFVPAKRMILLHY